MPSNTQLLNNLVEGQLTQALEEASLSGKRVYQTGSGVRVLTAEEAKTAAHAHLVGLAELERIYVANKHMLQPDLDARYNKAVQVYSKVMGVGMKVELEQLKQVAEVEGCGYKKANLDQVTLLCKEDFGAYKMRVPEYEGVASPMMQRVLLMCGLDLAGRWKAILEKHFPTANEQEELLRAKKYPEQFLTDCAAVRVEIESAVQQLILRGRQGQSLDTLFGIQGLDQLIDTVVQRKERLMVRSTGREDTKELANAGGNTSVPNVMPDKEHALEALGEVVTSYFGEKSLKQRLGVSDRTLFDPEPLTPVLFQRMIGERDPKALPKCGVMFTEDCQSKIGQASSTSGVTVIQSAYGHNEGVVSSLIPVDSYYVDEQHQIFPIVRPKTFRMMPTEKNGELQLMANDAKMAVAPSLSPEAVQTLKNFAERLEQFYGGPMDVEFVVDEQAKTVYIVQARPLVERKFAEASFLPDLKKLPADQVLQGSAIGAAGGALRLAKPHQIIVAPNLSEALEKYQQCEDPKAIEVIVVGRAAPSTSHWATVFHNEGKPVLYLDQLAVFQSWLNNPEAQLLISPQQGVAFRLKSDKPLTLEDLFVSHLAVKGWVDYPAAALLSASPQFQPREKLTDEALRAFYPILKDAGKWELFQKHAASFRFEVLFESMRSSQGQELERDLAMLLFKFKSVLSYNAKKLQLDDEQSRRVEALQSYALALAQSIRENGAYSPTDPHYCRKLLPIHFLQALIFSQASVEEVVEGHSLATVALHEMAAEQAIIEQLQKEGISLKNSYTSTLLRLGSIAIHPEIAQKYRTMVLTLDQEGRDQQLMDLARLLIQLNKLQLLSPWLNITFPATPEVSKLAADFQQQAPLFEKIVKLREIVNTLNVQAFAHPKSFNTQWQVLNKEALDPAKDGSFVQDYRQTDGTGKLGCVGCMNKLVDQFDLAIKALEGSSEYPQEKQLPLFQTMLKGYSDLANSWCDAFGFSEEVRFRLKKAREVIDKQNLSPSDLRFSRFFDVAAFGSRSGAALGRVQYPVTLEDAFSTIHQELLGVLAQLAKEAGGTELPKPPLVKSFLERMYLGQLTGIDLDSRKAAFHYTKPLREHGVQYHLSSRPGSDKLALEVRFSAANENDRWDKIIHYMITLKILGKFDLQDFELSDRGVGFTFHLDDKDDFKSVAKVLHTIESGSTSVASGGGFGGMNLSEAQKVESSRKGLQSYRDGRQIIEEFEKDCGVASMISSPVIRQVVEKLVREDPAYVESVMKKAWRCTQDFSPFFEQAVPGLLLDAGHAAGAISVRAVEMISSKYSGKMPDGINLLHMVSQKAPEALPDGCAKGLFKILLNMELRTQWFFGEETPFDQAFSVLERLMLRGKEAEQILEGMAALLTSEDEQMRADGWKVLDLLLKHQQHYPPDLKQKLSNQMQNVPPAVKEALDSKLKT
jgi:hypothetical protein